MATADVLHGGLGASLVDGRAGNDQLWGEAGNDTVLGGEDRIDLATVDANSAVYRRQAFTALIDASAAFTAAGQLRFADGVLYGNTDADADAEFSLALLGVTALELSDLVLAR